MTEEFEGIAINVTPEQAAGMWETMTPEQMEAADRAMAAVKLRDLENNLTGERLEQANMVREYFLKGWFEAAGSRAYSLYRQQGKQDNTPSPATIDAALSRGATVYQEVINWMVKHQAVGDAAQEMLRIREMLADVNGNSDGGQPVTA